MENRINAKRKAKDDIVAAAREFVAKVDRGEARSVKSYGAFKAALAVLDTQDEFRPCPTCINHGGCAEGRRCHMKGPNYIYD